MAVLQYEETSALQAQVNTLQTQIGAIPDESSQIYQLQQQVSSLQSRLATTTAQESTFTIAALCVDKSQPCPISATAYLFVLTVKNTGAVTIQAGSDNTVRLMGGNGTGTPFTRVFNITIQAVPPGSSTTVGLTSWTSVFGAGNQPPFSSGESIAVNVCLWETQQCQGMPVTAGS